MSEVLLFLDANTLASSVTRTLVIAGARADGLLVTWSAHVEREADRHARGTASRTSVVRREILGMQLAPSARSTTGLLTESLQDRQVMADAVRAGATFLITTDVDDFAPGDLVAHRMSAVNPYYFMALRFTERAYREAVGILAGVAKNPPRTEEQVHAMLGRRHPHLVARFADQYETTPVPPDTDQPKVLFRGAACVRCGHVFDVGGQTVGLCTQHRPRVTTAG